MIAAGQHSLTALSGCFLPDMRSEGPGDLHSVFLFYGTVWEKRSLRKMLNRILINYCKN